MRLERWLLTKFMDESFKLEKQIVALRFLRFAGDGHAPGKSFDTCYMHSRNVLAGRRKMRACELVEQQRLRDGHGGRWG